jgi:hypothetical protein
MAKEVKDKTVKVRIPYDTLNPNIHVEVVIINGRRFNIQKGVDVEVPEAVAEILKQAGRI